TAVAPATVVAGSTAAASEGYRLAAQLLWKYRSTKLDAASTVTLGDKAKEVWRDLLKINPFAVEDKLQLAEALGKPGVAEAQVLLKSVLESRTSAYRHQAEAARIAGKTGAQGLNFASAELRFIAGLESWRGTAKSSTPAPLLPRLPAAYYAPIYASRTAGAPGPIEALRQSLYVRPLASDTKDELNSRLFAALIRGFEQDKQLTLLVDLFEQQGEGFGGSFLVQDGEAGIGNNVGGDSGNPLEAPDTDSLAGPAPLVALRLSVAEKVTLMKSVIAAYSSLQANDLAARVAWNSASLAVSSRQAFLAQARQLENKAKQAAEALSARFSVNDTLGEELSRRKPISRPRRGRVRS
ncbi:MAG: hypothetical protein L0338_02150, partial [Acidobacteria bacterium]|nr:hypothetical protein [Acidobacteriota bacterium]